MTVCASCGRESPVDFAFCPACGAVLSAPTTSREVRKTITALFCDLVGSTTLAERHDPEVLKPVLQRYFEEMRAAVERHGGRVEKFIGDAVVAVFGIPQVHEDDALRAVRAAAEMRERLAAFAEGSTVELVCRIGLTTGEVLVAGEDQPPIGDTMNTAARLQSSAEPGEILIGEPTYRLVEDAVAAEPIEPLTLKGKTEPVPAYRLLRVASLSPMRTRRLDAPMVGRTRERVLLEQAFERARSDRACQLFTVLGAAGAGKSRLVEEFLGALPEADALRGRCLPYGDGITYFPVAEAMKEALGLADFDDESSVREKIHAAVAEEDHAEAITANLAKLLGAGEGGAPEETFWAIRRFLEVRGRERPVVVVFDDIHCGEPTFLDLVEHVADWSRDASILLLCMARPDLLDGRPGWAGGKTNAATISLAPLTEAECAELIDHLVGSSDLPESVSDRIIGVAEGNPLFVEEMLRMLIDDGLLVRDGERWVPAGDLGDVSVPPTISALLSARLDRLSDEERTLLEAAAVCGKEFHRGAIVDLVPEGSRDDVDMHLRSLVRRELVGPERSLLPGEDAYRFRHLLIRDAAYDAIPKHERADLHEAFAAWLEKVAGERVSEQEEILGYHLEQAYRLRMELGLKDDRSRALARRAAGRLAAPGERAWARGDVPASTSLLGRAADLLPREDPERRRLLPKLIHALASIPDNARAAALCEEAIEIGGATGDQILLQRGRVERAALLFMVEPERVTLEQMMSDVDEALGVFERAGDGGGLIRALECRAFLEWTAGNMSGSRATAERALEPSLSAGGVAFAEAVLALSGAMSNGPTPASQALAKWRDLAPRCEGQPVAEAIVGLATAECLGALGRTDEARSRTAEARRIFEDLGDPWGVGFTEDMAALLAWWTGDIGTAVSAARVALQWWRGLGLPTNLAMSSSMYARLFYEGGLFDEANELAAEALAAAGPWDIQPRLKADAARAKVLARRGSSEEAEELILDVERRIRATEFVPDTGDVLLAKAEVSRLAGHVGEAADAANEALEIFEGKEWAPHVARARAFLAELGASP